MTEADRGSAGSPPLLEPGLRLGRFVVRGLLGAGGMGRVYRAHDPGLGRDVAIKALAPRLHGDAESRDRIEREARVLATLNHPNLAAIHGLEVVAGAPYLVLELVEGVTLAQRLRQGPLPVREALALAVQVADGLAEAHGKGIVHCDLKPGNVVLGTHGRLKVLDFGLAAWLAQDAGAIPDRPAPGPGPGTAPYASPEQWRGQAVDARSDIWAFGALLYEMLTAHRAFPGRSSSEVMAAVLRDEPDWSALPSSTPPAVRRVLRRCLRKDPGARLQHVGDARLELQEAFEEGAAPDLAIGRRRSWPVAAGVLFVALAGLWLWRRQEPPRPPARVVQLSLEVPEGTELAHDYAAPFALAADGSRLALLATAGGSTRLYLRELDDRKAHIVRGSEDAWQPFFSPAGDWVAFFADRKLKKVPVSGGAPLEIAEVGDNPRGASWGVDGRIVLAPSQTSGLVVVPAEGGPLVPLTRVDSEAGERSHRWPQILPGGRQVLFSVDHEGHDFDDASLEVVSLESGVRKRVWEGAGFGRYLPSRHLVFAPAGRLYTVGFDLDALETRGEPRPALDGVGYDARNGGTQAAFSDNGTLVYVPGPVGSLERRLVFVDAQGRRTPLPGPARRFLDLRLDRGGRRAALRVGTPGAAEVWIQDVDSGRLVPLTHGLHPQRVAYSRDGGRLATSVLRAGRWQLLALPTGGGPEQVLLEGRHRLYACDWTPGDRGLVYQERRPDSGWDLSVLPLDATGRPSGPPRDLAASPAYEANARVSPDGRWLAYESDETDALVDVYVRPLAGGESAKASSQGCRQPVWGGPGELYCWASSAGGLRRASWREVAGRFDVSSVRSVWSDPASAAGLFVSEDSGYERDEVGARFLMLELERPPAPPAYRELLVLLGWFEELRRRAGGVPPAS